MGADFLTTIKKHPKFSSIPVIIYTKSDNQRDKDEMPQLNAAAYIVKQPDIIALKEILSRVLSLVAGRV
jgi:CheY-like chemotaxis protein